MTPAEYTSEPGNATRSKLRRLIIGRFVTAVLFIILNIVWTKARNPEQSLNKAVLFLIIVGGLTALYFLVHRFSSRLLFQGATSDRHRCRIGDVAGVVFRRHQLSLHCALYCCHRGLESVSWTTRRCCHVCWLCGGVYNLCVGAATTAAR